jgi:formylglycine-generating enzyme required for sulfatase activity
LVTQGAYLAIMNTNPSYFSSNQNLSLPVETVSWFDASNYCAELTAQSQAAGQIFSNWVYRLPTEAEWEFACRAGTITAFYYGSNLLSGMANFNGEYPYLGGIGTTNNPSGVFLDSTTPVGSYQSNALDLYDMAGNLREWCQDWYGAYPTNSVSNPQGPTNGTERIFRGGAFNSPGDECRSARRDSYYPTSAFNTIGFRVVLAPGP